VHLPPFPIQMNLAENKSWPRKRAWRTRPTRAVGGYMREVGPTGFGSNPEFHERPADLCGSLCLNSFGLSSSGSRVREGHNRLKLSPRQPSLVPYLIDNHYVCPPSGSKRFSPEGGLSQCTSTPTKPVAQASRRTRDARRRHGLRPLTLKDGFCG